MIDIDKLRKLNPRDGDIFLAPDDLTDEVCAELLEAITVISPGIKAMLLRGDLQQLDETDMNAAGWYRQ